MCLCNKRLSFEPWRRKSVLGGVLALQEVDAQEEQPWVVHASDPLSIVSWNG